MMKDALIQLGLTEEQADKVIGLHSEALQTYVPKTKLDEAETEKERLTTSLMERDQQLEALKGVAGASEDLKKKLDEAIAKNKADSEQAAADFAAYKKDNAVNLQLMKLGAKNMKAVKALLDLTKVSIDGENLIGLQDQLDVLRESDAYLFDPTLAGREPYGGDKTPPDEYKNNPFRKETFNLTKQGQILKENPDLARRLKAAAGNTGI